MILSKKYAYDERSNTSRSEDLKHIKIIKEVQLQNEANIIVRRYSV